jgi:hypothetical protein
VLSLWGWLHHDSNYITDVHLARVRLSLDSKGGCSYSARLAAMQILWLAYKSSPEYMVQNCLHQPSLPMLLLSMLTAPPPPSSHAQGRDGGL